MADDITLNGGSGGSTVATDEISSRHFQKNKLAFGADGTATDVETAARLPVVDTSAAGTVFVGTNLNNSANTHDVNTALSANGSKLCFWVTANAGSAVLTMELLQSDGGSYLTAFDVTDFVGGYSLTLEGITLDSVRITETATVNASYVLVVW